MEKYIDPGIYGLPGKIILIKIDENHILIKKKVARKDFHPLLFTEPMKEYMDIIIQAATDIASGKNIQSKFILRKG